MSAPRHLVAATQVDRAGDVVDADHLPRRDGVAHAIADARHRRAVPDANRVLLRVEPVPIHAGLLDRANGAFVSQRPERLAILTELLLGHRDVAEPSPPFHLLVTPV